MSERIKMNFPLMEEMARTFRDGAGTLEEAEVGVKQIIQLLADDTLLGQAGDALVDACASQLSPAISRLQEKLIELAADVEAAKDNMLEADRSAESLY